MDDHLARLIEYAAYCMRLLVNGSRLELSRATSVPLGFPTGFTQTGVELNVRHPVLAGPGQGYVSAMGASKSAKISVFCDRPPLVDVG